MTKKEQVRNFLKQTLQDKNDLTEFKDSDPLVSSGRLNSLDVVSVAAFLEETFGLNFADTTFDQYKFESVDSIAELLD